MNKGNKHISQTESKHLSLEQMQAYLDDTLPGQRMHQVERHLLDCDLCSDALEGLSVLPEPSATADVVAKLKQNIRKKSIRQPIIRRKKKLVTILWKPMSVAASILILLTAVFLLLRIDKKYRNTKDNISLSTSNPAPQAEKAKEQNQEIVSAQPAAPLANSQENIAFQEELAKPVPVPGKAITDKNAEISSRQNQEMLFSDKTAGLDVAIAPAPPVVTVPEAEEEESKEEKPAYVEPITPTKSEARREQIPLDVTMRSKASGISQSSVMITGKVVSDGDEVPLPGVMVTIKGATQGTTTDAEGKFKLLAPMESSLVISYIGFATEEVEVKGQEPLKINLTEDVSALSEVVVIGYGEKKSTDEFMLIRPQPVDGTTSFRNYLRKNLKYPQEAREKKVEGTVRVEFSVDVDGNLSEFKVKKGLGYGCDEEAVRLIQEGPAWKPATLNDEPVKRKFLVFVPFKLK